MGLPKGTNNGAKGKKGRSGRKSAYAEYAEAAEAFEILFATQNQEELEDKIRSGKFSLADRLKLSGMEGDTTILVSVLKKAVPDVAKLEHTGKNGGPVEITGVTINVRK